MNVNDQHVLILEMLQESDGSYGLDLVRNSNGKIKRWSVYIALQTLEDSGLVSSVEEQEGLKRRFYKITDAGKNVVMRNLE